jgi:hypothetical protein
LRTGICLDAQGIDLADFGEKPCPTPRSTVEGGARFGGAGEGRLHLWREVSTGGLRVLLRPSLGWATAPPNEVSRRGVGDHRSAVDPPALGRAVARVSPRL